MTHPMQQRRARRHSTSHAFYAAVGCIAGLLSLHCGSDPCEPGTACDQDLTTQALAADMTQPAGDGADDTTTIGDDRAGHVSCLSDSNAQSSSCTGEGVGCCAKTGSCSTYEACLDANDGNPMLATYQECDGPEDCAQGEHCWQEKGGTMCAASGGQVIKCHVDSDCPGADPACVSGECSPTGAMGS